MESETSLKVKCDVTGARAWSDTRTLTLLLTAWERAIVDLTVQS